MCGVWPNAISKLHRSTTYYTYCPREFIQHTVWSSPMMLSPVEACESRDSGTAGQHHRFEPQYLTPCGLDQLSVFFFPSNGLPGVPVCFPTMPSLFSLLSRSMVALILFFALTNAGFISNDRSMSGIPTKFSSYHMSGNPASIYLSVLAEAT